MRGEYTVLDRQIQYTMSRHFFSGKYNYNSDLTPSGVLYPREFRIRRYDTCRPIHDRPIHVSTCIYTKGENVTEDRGKRRPRPPRLTLTFLARELPSQGTDAAGSAPLEAASPKAAYKVCRRRRRPADPPVAPPPVHPSCISLIIVHCDSQSASLPSRLAIQSAKASRN